MNLTNYHQVKALSGNEASNIDYFCRLKLVPAVKRSYPQFPPLLSNKPKLFGEDFEHEVDQAELNARQLAGLFSPAQITRYQSELEMKIERCEQRQITCLKFLEQSAAAGIAVIVVNAATLLLTNDIFLLKLLCVSAVTTGFLMTLATIVNWRYFRARMVYKEIHFICEVSLTSVVKASAEGLTTILIITEEQSSAAQIAGVKSR